MGLTLRFLALFLLLVIATFSNSNSLTLAEEGGIPAWRVVSGKSKVAQVVADTI